jgi:hypothetical protein
VPRWHGVANRPCHVRRQREGRRTPRPARRRRPRSGPASWHTGVHLGGRRRDRVPGGQRDRPGAFRLTSRPSGAAEELRRGLRRPVDGPLRANPVLRPDAGARVAARLATAAVVPGAGRVRFQPVEHRRGATRLVELALGRARRTGWSPTRPARPVYGMETSWSAATVRAAGRHRAVLPVRFGRRRLPGAGGTGPTSAPDRADRAPDRGGLPGRRGRLHPAVDRGTPPGAPRPQTAAHRGPHRVPGDRQEAGTPPRTRPP